MVNQDALLCQSMKTVLITGINKGLGKALFEHFTDQGYHVIGLLRNKEAAKKLAQNLPDNAELIQADLSSDEAIATIQSVVQNRPIDLLINNAGITGASFRLEEVESAEVMALLNVHCLGVFRATKAVRQNLLQAENPTVINLNSRFGSITRQHNGTYGHLEVSYAYRIAKAAQNMLTACLKAEYGSQIKFISLHPGKIKTGLAQSDANAEPTTVAEKIFETFEANRFTQENGIVEIGHEPMQW